MLDTGHNITHCSIQHRMSIPSYQLKMVYPFLLLHWTQANDSVRQTLMAQPTNLSNLISHLSHHLFTLLPSDLFPSGSSNGSNNGQDTTREALNCLRVLGRVLVIVYEAEATAREGGVSAGGDFAREHLWSRVLVSEGQDIGTGNKGQGGVEDEGQFTIADSESEEEDEDAEGDLGRVDVREGKMKKDAVPGVNGSDPLSASTNGSGSGNDMGGNGAEEALLPSLIDRLFSCTIDLLFCAGFTVPESVRGQQAAGEKVNVSLRLRVWYRLGADSAVCDLGEGSREYSQCWI